jgi:hypothetical protein
MPRRKSVLATPHRSTICTGKQHQYKCAAVSFSGIIARWQKIILWARTFKDAKAHKNNSLEQRNLFYTATTTMTPQESGNACDDVWKRKVSCTQDHYRLFFGRSYKCHNRDREREIKDSVKLFETSTIAQDNLPLTQETSWQETSCDNASKKISGMANWCPSDPVNRANSTKPISNTACGLHQWSWV